MNSNLDLKILEAKDQGKYNLFAKNHSLGSIHQCWEWGIFQSKSKFRDKFWVIAIQDKNTNIIASALVIKQNLPMKKSWLYCPRGPLIDFEHLGKEAQNQIKDSTQERNKNQQQVAALQLLLKKIKEIAQVEQAVFLRIDPGLRLEDKVNLKSFGFKKAHAHYQPENTLILDLTQTEEQILAQMKPKGRYNIKVAQKHGVEVRVSDGNEKDLEAFYKLLEETTQRDGFSGHNLEYYKNMLTILGPEQVKLYLASYKGEIIGGIIATFFKDTAIYYFGASGNKHRNMMAPYLLQWRAICDAKKLDLKFYDFLGIAAEGAVKHAWAGVTDFKLKFGGKRVDYYPAQELVYKPLWYAGIKARKKLNK